MKRIKQPRVKKYGQVTFGLYTSEKDPVVPECININSKGSNMATLMVIAMKCFELIAKQSRETEGASPSMKENPLSQMIVQLVESGALVTRLFSDPENTLNQMGKRK